MICRYSDVCMSVITEAELLQATPELGGRLMHLFVRRLQREGPIT